VSAPISGLNFSEDYHFYFSIEGATLSTRRTASLDSVTVSQLIIIPFVLSYSASEQVTSSQALTRRTKRLPTGVTKTYDTCVAAGV